MQYMYNTKNKGGDISISELTKTHIEKKNIKKMVYDNIYKQCCEKIRYMNSQWHKTCCSFIVPSIQMGMPIYKMETCIIYLMYKLKQKGFYLEFLYPNKLNISWKHALIKELKSNDNEWHKITEGKLYGTGSGDSRDVLDTFNPNAHAPLSQIVSQTDFQSQSPFYSSNPPPPLFSSNSGSSGSGSRWDSRPNDLQRVESIRNAQAQTFQSQASSQRMPSQSSLSICGPPPPMQTHNRPTPTPPPMIISTGGPEEDEKDRRRTRRKRDKRRNEERYKNEQARIAEVVRRKNNEAMRALNFSTTNTEKDKKHKKVLQIKS